MSPAAVVKGGIRIKAGIRIKDFVHRLLQQTTNSKETHNDVSTSSHYVTATSKRRCFDVASLLG